MSVPQYEPVYKMTMRIFNQKTLTQIPTTLEEEQKKADAEVARWAAVRAAEAARCAAARASARPTARPAAVLVPTAVPVPVPAEV